MCAMWSLRGVYMYVCIKKHFQFSVDACCFQWKLTDNFTSHNREFPLEHTGILGNVRVFLGACIRAQAELRMPQAYRISPLDMQR